MKAILFLLCLILFFSIAAGFDLFGPSSSRKNRKTQDLPPISDQKAQQYLQNFGYLGPSNFISGSSRGSNSGFDGIKNAVQKFQEFAGLRQTGNLDAQTKKKMAQPRCGVTDVQAISSIRGEAAFKWNKQHLTYSIVEYSSGLSRDDVRRAMRRAFDTWSEVVPLQFTEVSSGESADIKIQFASTSHGDPWPFDGKGGVLAHATMPTSGLLHFDEDERWTFMNPNRIANGYTDLLNVAIHESGHALGLSHSRNEDSIMAPFYHETIDSNGNYITPRLTSYDIQAIQDIYGSGRGGSSRRPSSTDDSRFGSGGSSSFGRGSSGFGGRGSSRSDFGDFGSGFGSWNPWGSDRISGGSRSRLNWSSWSSFSDSDDFGSGGRTRTRGDEDTRNSDNGSGSGHDWFRNKLRSMGSSFGRFLEG
jgi:hypothetical protein